MMGGVMIDILYAIGMVSMWIVLTVWVHRVLGCSHDGGLNDCSSSRYSIDILRNAP